MAQKERERRGCRVVAVVGSRAGIGSYIASCHFTPLQLEEATNVIYGLYCSSWVFILYGCFPEVGRLVCSWKTLKKKKKKAATRDAWTLCFVLTTAHLTNWCCKWVLLSDCWFGGSLKCYWTQSPSLFEHQSGVGGEGIGHELTIRHDESYWPLHP